MKFSMTKIISNEKILHPLKIKNDIIVMVNIIYLEQLIGLRKQHKKRNDKKDNPCAEEILVIENNFQRFL